MNTDPTPAADTAQRRKLLIAISGAFVLMAAAAYFMGGPADKPAPGPEVNPDDKVAFIPAATNAKPGQDAMFPDLALDGLDSFEPPEPATATPPANGTANPPADPTATPSANAAAPVGALARVRPPNAADSPSANAATNPSMGIAAATSPTTAATEPTPLLAGPVPQRRTLRLESGPSTKPSPQGSAAEPAKSPQVTQHPPTDPPSAAVPARRTPSPSAPALALKQPRRPLPAIVAHTDGVITEREFAPSPQPASQAKPRVVKVTKPQAEAFAERSTQTWKAAGRIPAQQRFRLPKQAETSTTTIWREDDTPAKPTERKAFGLVLVDAPAEARPAPAITHTPEGIPVRNVPDGESALKKHGPDKPLWKRPE